MKYYIEKTTEYGFDEAIEKVTEDLPNLKYLLFENSKNKF